MIFTLNASCGSFIGNGRCSNEDNFYFNKKHLPINNKGLKKPISCERDTDEPIVFALFDGMGGESNGAEAAYISCEVFDYEYKKLEKLVVSGKEFMYDACEKANSAVNALRINKQLTATGTTVAAIYFSQDEVVTCNIGDSKIFRIRDKKMIQISEDHTDEKIIATMGINKKPVLLQYVGVPHTEMLLDPYILKGELCSGDTFVICTDGVTDVLDANELYEIVCDNNAQESVRHILAEVEKKCGADNATVIVIKII